MKSIRTLTSVALLALLLALPLCSQAQDPPAGESAAAASLRAAETAFGQSAADKDLDVFRSFLDEDAIFAGGQAPLRGAAAIVAGWSPFFADGGPTITWHPELVEVEPSGLLGMTRGPYSIRAVAPDGSERTVGGTFFSVWRRESVDASWRVVLDTGVNDRPCPEAPSEAEGE